MFNKEDYRHLKSQIIVKIKKDGIEVVPEYAALTGVPLIVQYELILEDMPEHKEYCENQIKLLREFFQI